MNKKAKLLFLIPSLRGGGAERVAVNLIPFLSKYFDLTLVLLENKIEYELPEADFNLISISKELNSIKGHLINTPFHIAKFYRLVKSLSPDIVLSFMEQANILNLAVSKLTKHKTIITQHVVPSKQFSHKGLLGKVIFETSKRLYNSTQSIIAVSKGVRDDLYKSYSIKKHIIVIPNPIDFDFIKRKSLELPGIKLTQKFFLCPGRLVIAHKAQDLLLRAFKKVLLSSPSVLLLFAGDGPDLFKLEALSKDLGISNNVIFLGWRKDLWPLMNCSIATVLASRYEGWPMVLIEAMAAGSPVIATDCPHGPKEILDDGRLGMLVSMEDENALSKAMIKMLSEKTRNYYKKLGEKRAKEFDINLIGMKYVNEILRVLKNN